MCLLCSDEKAYAAYMDYLDAMERQGEAVDPDAALDAVIAKLQAEAAARRRATNTSPFSCDPVEE